jgi:subfamily B ATP-binding cassette protein MsbA
LIEGTFIDKDPAVIRWIPVVIVGLYLVRGLATYVASYAMGWVGSRVVADLRNAMFAKLLVAPASYYD